MPQWQLLHRSNELFPAEIIRMEMADARALKRLGWEQNFDWGVYFRPNEKSDAYKLLAVGNNFIEGAIAYHIDEDSVFVDLLESAPSNRFYNRDREFKNVTDVLLGEACVQSFMAGKDGYVSFKPKTELYSYYERRFNAKYGGMGLMFLDNIAALRLIKLYYR
ncbi:hypothetical protein ABIE48_000445 [Paenibacillus sp. OAE614]